LKYLLIFDFDGTIANSLELGKEYANYYAKFFGYEQLEDIEQVRNESAVKYILSRIKWYFLPVWAILMKYQLKKNADKINLYSGIKELLLELSKIADLAIIGGGSVKYHNKILDRNNCNVFRLKIGNNGLHKHKAIKRLSKRGYPLEKMIMIGDDLKDIEAAKRSNIKSIAVTWGSSSDKILIPSKPDYLVNSVDQLQNTIFKLIQ
jgi:phosphoglycolate phosphatase